MSDVVPEGWKNTIIGEEISDISDGGTPTTTNRNYFGGGIPWININDIQPRINHTRMSLSDLGLQKSSVRLWDKGTIILSIGATIGKVGIAMKAVTTKQGICGVVPKPNVSVKYFYYFLVSIKQQLNTLSQGSTIKETRPPTIKKIQMCLPPLPEQKKIASILTSVDEVIENTQKQIDKLQDLKKATMNELLTKGIGHTEFKDSELGRIPKSWRVKSLTEMVLKITDGEHLSPKIVSQGNPILSAKDIREEGVEISGMKFVESIPFQKMLSRCKPEFGDVLIVSRGATIGRVTLNNLNIQFALMGSVILIKPDKEKLIGNFIALCLETENTQDELLRLSGSSAQQAIYLKDIKNLKLPIPSLSEQRKISSQLKCIDQHKRCLNSKLSQTQSLKKSLMQELLSGKVRVSVN